MLREIAISILTWLGSDCTPVQVLAPYTDGWTLEMNCEGYVRLVKGETTTWWVGPAQSLDEGHVIACTALTDMYEECEDYTALGRGLRRASSTDH